MSTPAPKNLHVEVDANVVRQLGEELITDAEQGLLELIKNSYDADAQVARVIVNTDDACESIPGRHKLKGSIVIEDDGAGMDLDAIEHGWLTISLSMKRALKERGKTTPKFHRTPLGDKGLGRLGTMKIGDTIEIMVVLENSNVAKLASIQYLSVHSLPQEDCYDTDDASAREIYPILVSESTMCTVQSSR